MQKNKEFYKIYKSLKRDLFSYVLFRVKNLDQAKDIVADVFAKLYKNLDKQNVRRFARPWAFRVAYNEIIDFTRKAYYKKNRSLQTNEVSPEDDMEEKITALIENNKKFNKLQKCIKKLMPKEQGILELRVYAELPYRAISVVLNISESAAKMRFNRTVNKLKKLCKDEK